MCTVSPLSVGPSITTRSRSGPGRTRQARALGWDPAPSGPARYAVAQPASRLVANPSPDTHESDKETKREQREGETPSSREQRGQWHCRVARSTPGTEAGLCLVLEPRHCGEVAVPRRAINREPAPYQPRPLAQPRIPRNSGAIPSLARAAQQPTHARRAPRTLRCPREWLRPPAGQRARQALTRTPHRRRCHPHVSGHLPKSPCETAAKSGLGHAKCLQNKCILLSQGPLGPRHKVQSWAQTPPAVN